jgi:diguanylate cyclase (GGDEF)-like protein
MMAAEGPMPSSSRHIPQVHSWVVLVVGLAAAALYAGAFFPARLALGTHAVHLATLPVLAVALLSGMRFGLLAAGVSLPLSALLLDLAGAPVAALWSAELGPIHLALLILTALLGREVDLGRRVEEERLLRDQAELALCRTQALFDAIPDDIYLSSADGKLTEARTQEQVQIDAEPQEATRPRPNARVLLEMEETLNSGEPRRIEFSASVGAEVFELEARMVRVGDDEALAIVRDLTGIKQLQEQALKDGLTGLFNHRFLQETLKREVARAKRYQHDLSLLFIDVDHFKQYNDTHGHPAGDALLRQLGRILANTGQFEEVDERGRTTDIPTRYGGEEFVVVLTETGTAGALVRAERLRTCIERFPFPGREAQPLGTVSVSIGVASYPDHADSQDALLKAADSALYAAKEGGRNQIQIQRAVADEDEPQKPSSSSVSE